MKLFLCQNWGIIIYRQEEEGNKKKTLRSYKSNLKFLFNIVNALFYVSLVLYQFFIP